MALNGRFFINLGGTVADLGAIRWGFRAPERAYENIGSAVGVTKVTAAERSGISYGVNQPRPARVRIYYSEASLDALDLSNTNVYTGAAIRFCEPDKLNDVLFGALNDKSIIVKNTSYFINNVTIK